MLSTKGQDGVPTDVRRASTPDRVADPVVVWCSRESVMPFHCLENSRSRKKRGFHSHEVSQRTVRSQTL